MHAASCPADLLSYVWERSLWSRPARRRRLSCRRIERVLKSIIADLRRPILRSPETGMVMKELFGKRRAQRCPSYQDLYISCRDRWLRNRYPILLQPFQMQLYSFFHQFCRLLLGNASGNHAMEVRAVCGVITLTLLNDYRVFGHPRYPL